MIRIGLDTNVLAYLAGVERASADGTKVAAARDLTRRIDGRADLVAPVQVWGELFTVLTRAGATRVEARAIITDFRSTIETVGVDVTTFEEALDLAEVHRLQMWDAIIVRACASAGCGLLLSEDMQTGFKVGSMTIANPFATSLDSRLQALLSS